MSLPPSPAPATSLRTLLDGILDYAGLFPPARLPLDTTIGNFVSYRAEPLAWMLGRFICPASRLDDLATHADTYRTGTPLCVSTLGTRAASASAFLDALSDDLQAMRAFTHSQEGRAVADQLETRWPGDVVGASADTLDAFLDDVAAAVVEAGYSALPVYLEIPMQSGEAPLALLDALARARRRHERPGPAFHVKMRCGGLEAPDFPATDLLASLLLATHERGLAFKATAGLHHPFRHYGTDVETMQHGFLNVFAGATLLHTHGLSQHDLVALLADQEGVDLRFDADGLVWNDHCAGLEAIRSARRAFAHSFGSCSFEEPVTDLHSLGLLG